MSRLELAIKELFLAGAGVASSLQENASDIVEDLAAKGGFAFGQQVPNEELHYNREPEEIDRQKEEQA